MSSSGISFHHKYHDTAQGLLLAMCCSSSLTEAHAEGGKRANASGHQSAAQPQQQSHTRAFPVSNLPSALLHQNLPSLLALVTSQQRPVRLHLRRPQAGHQRRRGGRRRLECHRAPRICLPILAIQPQKRSNPYTIHRFRLCITNTHEGLKWSDV